MGHSEGVVDKKGRGIVVKGVMSYIHMHKPRVVILENVRMILSKAHVGLVIWIYVKLKEAGYNVGIARMNTKEHNLPQVRERVYIVGLQASKQHSTFHFPEPIKNSLSLKMLMGKSDRKPQRTYQMARKGSKLIRWHMKRHIKEVKAAGGDPRKDMYVADCGSSRTFRQRPIFGTVPCVTVRRAQQQAYYVMPYGRTLSDRELCNLQGMPASRLKVDMIGKNDFRKIIGNAFSLNVKIKTSWKA